MLFHIVGTPPNCPLGYWEPGLAFTSDRIKSNQPRCVTFTLKSGFFFSFGLYIFRAIHKLNRAQSSEIFTL